MKAFVFVLCALALTPVFAQSSAQNREARAIAALENATKILAADDLSCKTVSDCEVLEMGSLACGGPKDFLLASKKSLNYSEITALAQQTVAREDLYNRKWGVISTCLLRAYPPITCKAKVCQTAAY